MPNPFTPAGGAFLIKKTNAEQVFIPEHFTSEDLLIGKTAEEFLNNEVQPHVEQIETGDHDLMRDLMRKAGELGLLGADVPEAYGGLGLPQTTCALIAEKLNPQQSFALTHEAHTVIATLPLLFFGSHEQKQKYLPQLASGEWVGSFALSEANSGSDALAMQTRATLAADGSHYTLNGEKMWITNSAFAGLFTVFARVQVNGEDKIGVFLVERDTPGLGFGKEEHKLGMHGTSTRRVILNDVQVPTSNAFGLGQGHYAAFCALNMGRFKLEAGATGGLKYLLSICAKYATQRKTFGRPIAEYGLIQHKLAEMAARTFALESMVYRLAGDMERAFAPIVPDAPDASLQYHRASEEYAIECGIVKVIGSETYSNMADEAIQIHGGYGYTEEFPVARAWRDQRLLRIGEGANEIVRLAIVNTLLRRDKAGRLPILQAKWTLGNEYDDAPEPLRGLGRTSQWLRTLGVAMLQIAYKGKWDIDLSDMQEVSAAIADVICSAYALESMALRCTLLHTSGHAHYAAAIAAAQVARIDYTNEAIQAAGYFSQSTPADIFNDQPGEVMKFGHPMQLRRDLAALVLEAGGYPL